MIMYIDVFIIKNTVFNFIVLFLFGKILRLKLYVMKYMFAASFGAIVATILIFVNINLFLSNLIKGSIAIVMLLMVYPMKSIKEIINKCCIFIIITSFVGGNIMVMNFDNTFITQVIGFGISGVMLYIFHKIQRNKIIYEKLICEIIIEFNDKFLKLDAFVDTGNTLKDALSDESVIFVFEDVAKDFFADEVFRILKSEVFEFDEKYFGIIRMLGCKTINSENEILVGVKVDRVIIKKEGCVLENKNVIVALSKNMFSSCEALVGLNILEEGYIYGDNNSFKNEGKKIME